MYDPEMRKDCPMRGSIGNCSPVGGFCMDAVSDEICESVHNAYGHGFYNALKTLKAQETNWTSVEDEMPENEAIVIGYTPCDGYMFVGYHKTTKYGSGWYIITAMRSWKKMTKKVTHWRPLPEPPVKGK